MTFLLLAVLCVLPQRVDPVTRHEEQQEQQTGLARRLECKEHN